MIVKVHRVDTKAPQSDGEKFLGQATKILQVVI